MFILGMVIGVLVGTLVGIVIMSLMFSSSNTEEQNFNFDKSYMTETSKEISPIIDKNKKGI